MWNCVNNKGGHCNPEPYWEEQPKEVVTTDEKRGISSSYMVGGTCGHDWKNCDRYSVPKDPGPVGSGVRFTVTKPEGKVDKKSVKKEKKESLQGQLF